MTSSVWSAADSVSRGRYWQKMRLREEFLRQPRTHLRGYVTQFNPGVRDAILGCVGNRILDVGAGNRLMETRLREHGYAGVYHSVDVNEEFPHEYRSLDEVRDTYDTVFMFELIAHLTLDEFDTVLGHATRILAPGGRLLISTPNPGHFNQLWRTDMTHITAYPLHDLYTELRVRGYRCEIYYLHQVPQRLSPLQWVRRTVYRVLVKFLYVDAAEGIMIVGTNAEPAR